MPECRNAGIFHYNPSSAAALVFSALLLLSAAQAQAALVCTPGTAGVIDAQETITLPDFDAAIPLEPVGRWYSQRWTFNCTASAPWNNRYQVAFAPSAHTATITNTGQTAISDTGGSYPVFTNPALSALGLGYILYWHTRKDLQTQTTPPQILTSVNAIGKGNGFINEPATAISFRVWVWTWMHYVKIAPLATYETAHTITPQPAPIGSFFVTDSDNPSQPPANQMRHLSLYPPTLTLTRRTCTTPSPTYHLGYAYFMTDFPTVGSVSNQVEFTLTFNCPNGYNFVGISFVPVEGAANEALHPGVMNSNLPGVGVQLLTRLQELDYPSLTMPLLPTWQPVKFNKTYWLSMYLTAKRSARAITAPATPPAAAGKCRRQCGCIWCINNPIAACFKNAVQFQIVS